MMRCILWYFALLPSVLGIIQPHNSRTSHRGLRSNVYLPPTLRLSNPHIVKEKYCALFRANGSTTETKIPVTMTLGKIFHYVTIEVFDTFYRTGRVGSLSIQTLSRNASIWSRLSNCVGDELWTCMFGDININIVAFKEKHNHPTTATPTLTSTLTVTSGCDHVAVGKTINPSSSSSTSSSSSSSRLRLRDDVEVVTAVGAVARAIAPLIFHNDSHVRYVHHVTSPTAYNISVHARFGDACEYFLDRKKDYGREYWWDGKRPCFTFDVYLREIEVLSHRYHTTNVLIETDSSKFLHWLIQNKSYNYYYVQGNRSAYDVCHGHGGVCQSHQGWMDHRSDLTPDLIDMSLAGLHLLQYGHAFIGGLWSHYSRAVYFLMTGQLGYPPPYISLDGGGVIASDKVGDHAAVALLWQAPKSGADGFVS